jgi:ATP-dependent DNA ligase
MHRAPAVILRSSVPAKLHITHRDLALPTKRAKAFSDPAWVFELKHDGYRVLAIRDGPLLKLLSRRGNELIGWFPEIAKDLAELPDVVIDGELVILDSQGHSEFQKLRGRCAIRDLRRIEAAASVHPAAVFAFDLLAHKGVDLRRQSLLKRKGHLQRALKKKPNESCTANTLERMASDYSPRQTVSVLKASSRRSRIRLTALAGRPIG